METERQERINAIIALAIELDADLQEQYVRQAAAGDHELAEEVLSLLKSGPDDTFLRTPLKVQESVWFGYPSNSALKQLRIDLSAQSERTADLDGPLLSESPSSADWSGKKIGSYRILDVIGKGGMGIVYRAYDESRNRFVALKTLLKTPAATLDRFKHEFRVFAGLNHPNLVSLYELVADGEHWWFTMELVEGDGFLDYIGNAAQKSAAVDTARLKRLRTAFRQLAEAVAALHSAEKLHRDLKPGNVLVTPDERVVLLDFGLGAELDDLGTHETTEDHILGSVAYMSPEQAGTGKISAASDWYSFGVMLYQALTGCLPFEGPLLEILRAKEERDGPAPSEIDPNIPEDLDQLCVVLLRRKPSQRIDAAAILKRLGAQTENAMVGPTSGIHRDAVFVGRGPELQCLRDAYDSSRRKPIIVYVKGDSGAGKTSLVQRFLAEISGSTQTLILTGRCLEQESVPFKALDSLIDSLVRQLRHLKREQLDPLLPRDIRALARLFPVMWRVPGVAEAPVIGVANPDPAELRHRAAAALGELLARLGDRHPLILFIDDLQWGDKDSASLLSDILTPPYAPNFLGIGCFRTEDAAGSPFLQALEDFRRRAMLSCEERQLNMGELDPDDTRELARKILGGESQGSDTSVVDAVARESAGRPFLVYELVEHLQSSAEGLLDAEPLALGDVLWRRIKALPEQSRHFLELVAVASRPIEDAVVCRAAGLFAANTAVVSALKTGRLIRSTPAGARNHIEIYHDRVREVVLQHLSASSLENRHQRLATVFSGSAEADPELLALHESRGGMTEAAASHYVVAAKKATEALAFDHAVLLYHRALELKSWAVDEQGILRTELGDALRNAGRGADAAQEYLDAARDADPVLALDLQHRASLAFLTSGHVDEGLSYLHPVMKSIGMRLAASPWQALLSLLAGRARVRLRGTQFVETREEFVSPATLRRIDVGWSVVLGLSVIDPIRGADFQTRNLLLALDAGEPYRVARALAVEAAHLASSGGVHHAKKVLVEAERLASRLQDPYTSGILELARGVVSYFEECWSDSIRFCRVAAETFRLHCKGATWEINTANAFMLWSLAKRGCIAELSRISPALLKEARDRGDLYATTNVSTQIMTLVRLAADDPDGALRELNLIMCQWSQIGYHVQHHDALLAFVPLELYVSEPEAAWNRVQTEWKAFRRSLLSHIQDLRIEMLQLRSYCALAMAVRSKNGEEYIATAQHDAKRLRGEGLPWTLALHDYIAGAVAHLRGDDVAARENLANAIFGFDRVGAGLQAAVTRRRLAELSSGEKATLLWEAADVWLHNEGVANPQRMATAFAPGFRLEAK
jgi:serine/threonine protein kinase